MSYANYKQADSRWGKKNYNGSSTMATAGCGPTSVANLAFHVDGKTTPWDVAKYMQKHGYAIRNNGTAWDGIPAAMKAFGLIDVKNVAKMPDVFAYLAKGYCAVFLTRYDKAVYKRTGVLWTTAGHFISVTAYKKQNGKDYVYTRDPGGRDHTGWYCYQDQLMGWLPEVWVGKAVQKKKISKPTGKYTGAIPKPTIKYGSTGDGVKALQKFLNWYGNFGLKVDGIAKDFTIRALETFQSTEEIQVDGVYGNVSYSKAYSYKAKTNAQKIRDQAVACAWAYGTDKKKYSYPNGSATSAFKKAIANVYPGRSKWGKQTRAGASCDVFAGTVIRSSGYDTSFPRGLDGVEKHCKDNPLWKNTGIRDLDELKPGDVVFYLYKGGGHIYIYVGNGKIANAHYNGKTYGIVQKLSSARKPADTMKFIVYRAAK